MAGSVSGEFTARSTDISSDGQDAPEVDNAIEDFLKSGKPFEFSYKGHNYAIVQEQANFVAYDDEGNVVDPNVQVNNRNTVDGFIEVRGLYETHGNALYIGNDPSSNSSEILFLEGDHNFNRSSLGENPFLATLLSKSVDAFDAGYPVDFESLKSSLNFDDAQSFPLDNDSSINIEELDLYLRGKLDVELSDDQLNELFDAIDGNGSGNIREGELDGYTGSPANGGSLGADPDPTPIADTPPPENDTNSSPPSGGSEPSQAQSFTTQSVELSRVKDDDGNQVNRTFNAPFVLAMNQSGDKSSSSPEVVDARDNFRLFTTHDGYEVETKYQKLISDGPTVTDPNGANYAIIKFSSGGNDSTQTPNLERLGLDPADEGVTYRIVGRDPDASRGEDGYDGVYGSHDSAQLVIEIIDPDAAFTFADTPYSEGSVTFLKTDAEVEVLGGNYVDDRSDERYVTYNPEASLTVYHEDQGTITRRLDNLVKANPYGAYLGDDGSNNWIDNVTAFLNPEELQDLSGGKGLHGNGSYLNIRLS